MPSLKNVFLLRKLYSPMRCPDLSIAPHHKANVRQRDRIYLHISILSALQYIISAYPHSFIALFPVVLYIHANVLLGAQHQCNERGKKSSLSLVFLRPEEDVDSLTLHFLQLRA